MYSPQPPAVQHLLEELGELVGNLSHQLLVGLTLVRLFAEDAREAFQHLVATVQVVGVVGVAHDSSAQLQVLIPPLEQKTMPSF